MYQSTSWQLYHQDKSPFSGCHPLYWVIWYNNDSSLCEESVIFSKLCVCRVVFLAHMFRNGRLAHMYKLCVHHLTVNLHHPNLVFIRHHGFWKYNGLLSTLWEHIRYSRASTIPLVLSPWQWVLHPGWVEFFSLNVFYFPIVFLFFTHINTYNLTQ